MAYLRLLLLAGRGAHSCACAASTPVYYPDLRNCTASNCTAISLGLLGHCTGRDAILRTAYPSPDPVEEAVVVNQVLLFQYLYRSEDELGEGLGLERQQASTLSQASHKECASSTITPNLRCLLAVVPWWRQECSGSHPVGFLSCE